MRPLTKEEIETAQLLSRYGSVPIPDDLPHEPSEIDSYNPVPVRSMIYAVLIMLAGAVWFCAIVLAFTRVWRWPV